MGPRLARGSGAAQGREPGVENRVADDGVAVLVVLVPAPAPVGDDDGGPVLPDEIAHRQARLIAEGNLPVRISEERGLSSEHSGCLLGGCALQRSILLGRHGGMSALAERQAQEDAASAAVDMLSDGSAHGEEAVTRMRGNGHDGRWHEFLWERLKGSKGKG